MSISAEEKNRYLSEAAIVLAREGFQTDRTHTDGLRVQLDGSTLCEVTESGGIAYRNEDINEPERIDAKDKVYEITRTIAEYMRQMETAPFLKADGLEDGYKVLADFNGTVLAGVQSKHGVHFVTWDWAYGHTGVAFEYLSPHLDGLEISLNEVNDLAAQLAALDEVHGIAFEGLFSIAVQRKVNANGGVITLQDLRDLAVSAKTGCYHVVDAADDTQLGRFYAENGFIPELDGISDGAFEMLDFAGIGEMMRHSENGAFVGSLYVLRDGELTTAPPVQKTLPEKPGYLFRLALGLCPDFGGDRTAVLDLPASEDDLEKVQEQLGADGWEGVMVLDYDGITPQAAEFADLPMEPDAFNEFAESVKNSLSYRPHLLCQSPPCRTLEGAQMALWRVLASFPA